MKLAGGILGAFRRKNKSSSTNNKSKKISPTTTTTTPTTLLRPSSSTRLLAPNSKSERSSLSQAEGSWFLTAATATRRRSDLQSPLFPVHDDDDDTASSTEGETSFSNDDDDKLEENNASSSSAPSPKAQPLETTTSQTTAAAAATTTTTTTTTTSKTKKKKKGERPFELNPWYYIQNLPPYEQVVPSTTPTSTNFVLPPLPKASSSSVTTTTLVLDLDETLVHSSVEYVEHADFVVDVHHKQQVFAIHVLLRPGLMAFLEAIHQQEEPAFEVVVFTASRAVYADQVLDRLDPDGKYFQHRLYRESCLPYQDTFLKDLNVLGRDLSRTLLVDNSPHTFAYHLDNGVPIQTWLDDPQDTELSKLQDFLLTRCVPLAHHQDIRHVLRETYGCRELVRQATATDTIICLPTPSPSQSSSVSPPPEALPPPVTTTTTELREPPTFAVEVEC